MSLAQRMLARGIATLWMGRCTSQHMVAHAHGSVDAPICGPPQAMLSSARTSCDAQYVDIAQVQRYGEGLMYRVKFRARIDRND